MKRQTVALLVLCLAPNAWGADYDVVASGRCVYAEGGQLHPVAGARVELRDQDFSMPTAADVIGPFSVRLSGNDLCAVGVSGADGRFTLRGRCGDVGPKSFSWTKPDLYVRCALTSDAGRVFAPSVPFTLYNAATKPRSNDARALDAGDVQLPAGAAKVFAKLNSTYATVRQGGARGLIGAYVLYPGGKTLQIPNTGRTYFASYTGAILMQIAKGDEDGTVAHEYGHSLHFQSFLQDQNSLRALYNTLRGAYQGATHKLGLGHTFSTKTNEVMAWAEGFAEFIEGAVFGTGTPDCSKWKELGANESERVMVEGNIACRLVRLHRQHGLRDIWAAQVAAKAMRWVDFLAEYRKRHANAASVAVGAVALPATTATVRAAQPIVAATPRLTSTHAAVTHAVTPRSTPATRSAPRLAEARARCHAMHRRLRYVHVTLGAFCPSMRDAQTKARCLKKVGAIATVLQKPCP
jgi:hypothetical protein